MHTANKKRKCSHVRAAMTLTEVMIAATVVTITASMIATLSIQAKFIWKDIRHHRLAVNELSNQLDELTRMDLPSVRSVIDDLQVSSEVGSVLRDATLQGTISSDELGNRLELELNWKRRYPGKPLRMSGWIFTDHGEERP